VAVGDTWELTGKDLDAAALGGSGTTEGRALFTFKEIREVGGQRCALIAMTWDVESIAKNRRTKVSLEGEMLFSLDRKILASVKGTGKMVIKSQDQEDGQGTFSMDVTTTLKEK
jgi:hypothetical protein